MTRSFVVATAGHVDHGKSALVRALTGTDPDRLPEEKARGITIDLGFAHLSLTTPSGKLDIGIVDVPGHEDFVKNMVAGALPADAALIVVAADDGPMPQTAEHLEILAYAGLTRGVVALTKADRLPDATALAASIENVRQRLARTPLAGAAIVPTSAHTGRGLDALRAALADALLASPPRPSNARPRLAVDRVFSARGVGTVVTGTLTGGALSRGQSVLVRPGNTAARVRGLQTFGRAVDTAAPGSRVAVNLPDLAAAVAGRPSIARGDTLTTADPGDPPTDATVIDAELWRVADATGPLPRDGTQVRLHHGTAAVSARLRFRNTSTLPPGGRSLARLTLARPLPALLGDRFVLRSDSDQHTLAGGVVLDINPPRRPAAAQTALLSVRAANDSAGSILVTQAERDGIVDPARLRAAGVPIDALTAAQQHTAAAGRVVIAGSAVVWRGVWDQMIETVIAAVDTHHAAHPDERGLPLAAARSTVLARTKAAGLVKLTDAVLQAVVAALQARGVARHGDLLARADHRPALPPALRAAGERLRRTLGERPFDPPSRNELCPTREAEQALRFLTSTGEAVDVGSGLVMAAAAYADAVRKVRDYLSTGPAATVSELKALLGSSRRVMVPLLEKFDRDRVTRRNGDTRTLGENAGAVIRI